jgi:hypothetical protein
MVGFIVSYLALIALLDEPARWLVYVMVAAQGLLGYGLASLFGAIPAEIFAGRHNDFSKIPFNNLNRQSGKEQIEN